MGGGTGGEERAVYCLGPHRLRRGRKNPDTAEAEAAPRCVNWGGRQ